MSDKQPDDGDWLAEARRQHGPITPDERRRAEAMLQAADVVIWELELGDDDRR
jgi:hypothetical protein